MISERDSLNSLFTRITTKNPHLPRERVLYFILFYLLFNYYYFPPSPLSRCFISPLIITAVLAFLNKYLRQSGKEWRVRMAWSGPGEKHIPSCLCAEDCLDVLATAIDMGCLLCIRKLLRSLRLCHSSANRILKTYRGDSCRGFSETLYVCVNLSRPSRKQCMVALYKPFPSSSSHPFSSPSP